MKKLNQQFIDSLTNFVCEQTGNLPKYENIIQSCINDLEARSNHEDNGVVITLMQDPENPKLFTWPTHTKSTSKVSFIELSPLLIRISLRYKRWLHH